MSPQWSHLGLFIVFSNDKHPYLFYMGFILPQGYIAWLLNVTVMVQYTRRSGGGICILLLIFQ